MKTSKTRVSSLALLLLTVCMVIGLSACNLFCQHQWQDATCTAPKTCSLCQQTEGEALGHTGGTATCAKKAVCTVCNEEYGDFAAHAFTEEVAKDEALKSAATCTSAATYYKSCACGAISTNDADTFLSGRIGKHQYEGNICSICGFDAGDSYYYNFVESIVTTNRISLKIDNFVYEMETNDPSPSGIQKINSVNVAELELYYEDGKLGGAAHGTINATYFGSVKQSGEFSAVISDNYLYFYATDGSDQNVTYKISLEEVLNQYLENIMYGDAEMNLEFLSFITDTVLPTIEILAEGNRTDINKLLERTLTAVFTFEKQADGSVLVKPSKDKALALNQALANQTISEIIDTYYGNDAFDSLVDFTYEILDMKLSEIPNYVKDKGVDYDDFIAKLQNLIHVLGAPEEGEEGYVDINEQITNSEYSDTILGNLITSTDDYKAEFEKHIWSELRATTFYEAQGYEKEDQAEIDNAITEIFNSLNASCTTNSAGEFIKIGASLNKAKVTSNSYFDGSGTVVTTEVFITCSFEILADGQINVTWGNIVDDYNNAVAPIPDSLKENAEFDIDNYDHERITVRFKNQLFYCSSYSYVYVSKPNYDVAILSGIASNCGDWNNYMWLLPEERYFYEIYFKKDSDIIFLEWDYYNAVQLTPISGGFCVTYEDGTTKDIMVETAGKDIVKLAADLIPQIYDNFEPRNSSDTVTYYYNTATGEYAYEEQHDWTYTYNKFGDACSDGYEYTQICSKCNAKVVGYNDYHYYETTEVDLKELGLCGGIITIQKCRACDYSYMYHNNSDCDWDWISNSDGYETYSCADCGAIRKRQSTYGEKVDGCEYKSTETYIYILNGVEVFNHTSSNTYTNHSSETSYELFGETCADGYKEITTCKDCGYSYTKTRHPDGCYDRETIETTDLSTLGMCGGYIQKYACTICETDQGTSISDYYCNWLLQSEDSDGYSVYKCPWCNAIKKVKTTTTKDENCKRTETTEYIYIVNDEEIYRYESTNNYGTDHDYEYSFEMDGATCEDGYKMIRTCKDCGDSYSGRRFDHYTEDEHTDLSELGLCGGYINRYHCVVPGCTYTAYPSINDYSCSWQSQGETDGYSIYKCSVCNAVKKIKSTESEKDENCEYTETQEYIYIVNGTEVYHTKMSYNRTNHVGEYSYEFYDGTCENGYIKTEICTTCGCVMYSSEYTYHNTLWDSVNLSDLGMCGGYVQKRYCSICNTVEDIQVNDYGCYWQQQEDDDDGYSVYKCYYCNAIKKAKVTETEKDANCQYTRVVEYIFIVKGEEVYRIETSDTYTAHEDEYSYEMFGATCDDGYRVTRTCAKCGYSYSWTSSGHDTESKSVYFDEFGLCGGHVYEYRCEVCNTLVDASVYDYGCYWQQQEDDDDGYSVYECYYCNAIKKEKTTETEKDANCQYTRTEEYIFIVNGEEVYRIETSDTYTAHEYEYSYKMLGATCGDGYRVTETCTDCGYNNGSWTSYGHDTSWKYLYFEEHGVCGNSHIEEYGCDVCGDIFSICDYLDDCNFKRTASTDTTNAYCCTACGLIKMEVWTDDGSTYTFILLKDGKEIYRASTTA